MWRIFRWLDRHEPGFYKLTVMTAGLGVIAGTACILFFLHPAAGLVFGYASIFALLRASHVYRFSKKERSAVPQHGLPIADASEDEVLRRVRRSGDTEKLRRHIQWLAANEEGKRGDRARGIVATWEAANSKKGDA